ncbi:hypothetical protein HSBGL_2557 [Halapricum desulfuricans]|uniref:Uncharacterized protein n=1 Tax=Halapricum desulfuricans TaxID=2841257 RepID=A0A897NL00_9EURY|nr:hypothetical protein HSBGL_2557 [Halapricum desulfuricans]
MKCLGVKPRGFLFPRRALQIPQGNPQGAQSPQAWIRPLPDLLGDDDRASDRPCFWTLSQTRWVPSHFSV